MQVELDHYVAIAAGGTHTLDNARPSCRPCNRRKTNTTDREAAKAFRAQAPASVQPLGKFAKAFMSGALVALAFGVLGGQMKWVSDAHQYEKERHGGHGDDGQWAHDDPGVRGA